VLLKLTITETENHFSKAYFILVINIKTIIMSILVKIITKKAKSDLTFWD